MWYRQALAIGKAQGTIQCTYAIIYDKSGNKLFALQRKNFEDKLYNEALDSKRRGSDVNSIVVDTHYGSEGIIAWQLDARTGGEFVDTGYIAFDLPLVIADVHSEDRLIPVRLDYNAIAYIKRTLSSAKQLNKYTITDKDGNVIEERWSLNQTTKRGYEKKGYTITVTKDYHPRWLKLSQSLNDTDTFYVKPAAFDWQPIDVSHMNDGSNPEWVLRRKKAEDNLRKAKILLALAGVATATI